MTVRRQGLHNVTFSQNVSPRTRSATGATLSDHVFGFLPNGQVRQQLKTDSLQKLTPGLVAIPNQNELGMLARNRLNQLLL
ncbi:hypothetical protein Vpro01_04372 [Vibrio proteolyticus]